MEPIPQTRLALAEIFRFADDHLTAHFEATAARVSAIAPDCMGMTLSFLHEGLAFTWASTGLDTAALDAAQYLNDGPCLRAIEEAETLATRSSDPLDEESWQLFYRAENNIGVASTLSIPLVRDQLAIGGVNLYGATATAFDGLHEALAEACGGWAGGIITNADLSLSGVRRAAEAPRTLADRSVTEQAVGMIMAARHTDELSAKNRLKEAADRAGLAEPELATILVKTRIL